MGLELMRQAAARFHGTIAERFVLQVVCSLTPDASGVFFGSVVGLAALTGMAPENARKVIRSLEGRRDGAGEDKDRWLYPIGRRAAPGDDGTCSYRVVCPHEWSPRGKGTPRNPAGRGLPRPEKTSRKRPAEYEGEAGGVGMGNLPPSPRGVGMGNLPPSPRGVGMGNLPRRFGKPTPSVSQTDKQENKTNKGGDPTPPPPPEEGQPGGYPPACVQPPEGKEGSPGGHPPGSIRPPGRLVKGTGGKWIWEDGHQGGGSDPQEARKPGSQEGRQEGEAGEDHAPGAESTPTRPDHHAPGAGEDPHQGGADDAA